MKNSKKNLNIPIIKQYLNSYSFYKNNQFKF